MVAEGALDAGETLIGADHVIGGQSAGLDTGTDDIKTVEPSFVGDAGGVGLLCTGQPPMP
jgi:hypothetical protein